MKISHTSKEKCVSVRDPELPHIQPADIEVFRLNAALDPSLVSVRIKASMFPYWWEILPAEDCQKPKG
jgi:hypothetical protein